MVICAGPRSSLPKQIAESPEIVAVLEPLADRRAGSCAAFRWHWDLLHVTFHQNLSVLDGVSRPLGPVPDPRSGHTHRCFLPSTCIFRRGGSLRRGFESGVV